MQTAVILMWHMHQPLYKDPLDGRYLLPWVYLHAVKDYYDMAAIVDETPGALAVFNFVPSLLEQLEEYVAGVARDPWLEHGQMDPAVMDDGQRAFLVANFFCANKSRQIEPSPRYLELYRQAARGWRTFSDQDLRDLQCCFFLSWTGPVARRHFPALGALADKGRDYTGSDRERLFALHRQLLAAIVPLYRKLHDTGKAELSVTPHFHPIMPLLCGTDTARVAMPQASLPQPGFYAPVDAASQLRAGVACFERVFGCAPRGCWPSEGAVSDEALAQFAGSGLAWAASDEAVLAASSGGCHHHPYRHDRSGLSLFFRDHELSDLIGFAYSGWDEKAAVADFVARLQERRGARVVPVILDGENAWEHYADNGHRFLSLLYATLAATEGVRLATCSSVLADGVERELGSVFPGSWINADYGIWIGHHEENRAWGLLAAARAAAVAASPEVARLLATGLSDLGPFSWPAGVVPADARARAACRALFAAQGSDWFWWYGDDHATDHGELFDLLFRRHLQQVYRLCGLEPPAELAVPIRGAAPTAAPALAEVAPRRGEPLDWLAAGRYDLSRLSGTMHADAAGMVLYYGLGGGCLHLRLDGRLEGAPLFLFGEECRVRATPGDAAIETRDGGCWRPGGQVALVSSGDYLELSLPLSALAVPLEVAVVLPGAGRTGDGRRWPLGGFLALVSREGSWPV